MASCIKIGRSRIYVSVSLFVTFILSSYPYGPYESTIFTMRSFYILIPTLAIANMGGANAQLQKSGAENIRSGVIQRAIAITGKRQIHSADFSSGGPSPDGGFVDPLRSNHGRKGTRDAVDEKLLANRGLLSGLTSGFQNIFGLGAGTSLQDTANANAAAGTTTTVSLTFHLRAALPHEIAATLSGRRYIFRECFWGRQHLGYALSRRFWSRERAHRHRPRGGWSVRRRCF